MSLTHYLAAMTKLAGGLVSHPLVNLLGGQLKLDYLLFVWEFSTKKYRAELGMTRAIQKHPFWELLSWPNLFMAGDCSRRATIFGAPSPLPTTHTLQPTAYARWMLIIPHLHANSPPILFFGTSLSIASSSPSLSLSLSLLAVVCRCNRRRR